MPQIFQVLRCYKCHVFQVHQTKKSNKFECKLCGEKQSIKRHYGIGTAKDCRLHVQRLNGIRGEIDGLEENKTSNSDEENELANIPIESHAGTTHSGKSKWSEYVDKQEEETLKSVPETETMYLNHTEVVLEVPKKRRRTNFNCPNQKTCSDTDKNPNYGESISNNVIKSQTGMKCVSYSDVNFKKLECNVVFNENSVKLEPKPEVKEYVKPPITSIIKEVSKTAVPVVNTNSKWAQFVEEEQEDDVMEENKNFVVNNESFLEINYDNSSTFIHDEPTDCRNSQKLFALCNDSDLDHVLDI